MAAFPTLYTFFNSRLNFSTDRWSHSLEDSQGSILEEQHERMRNLAYSETYKRESPGQVPKGPSLSAPHPLWTAPLQLLTLLPIRRLSSSFPLSKQYVCREWMRAIANTTSAQMPLALQVSSASLGAVTMYRTTAETLFQTISDFMTSIRLFFQGVFLMASFHVALDLEPMLSPDPDDREEYITNDGGLGMKIDIRDTPTLHDVNFHVEPGEVVAIVCIILMGLKGLDTDQMAINRLCDFDEGDFRINDLDVRRYVAGDLHASTSAVFQDFSQFNASLRENVGVGCTDAMTSDIALRSALQAGGAGRLLDELPDGLDSLLDGGFCFGDLTFPQWQRVAIARAFMRPNADLYVFDEANSALDPVAQSELFERIYRGCVRDEA
ncbi:3796_t:CDS:2, partial [Acaulospora colombiana]